MLWNKIRSPIWQDFDPENVDIDRRMLFEVTGLRLVESEFRDFNDDSLDVYDA